MKKIISDYTFTALSRTVELNGFVSINLEGLLLITNVTDNVIIYSFADPSRGATIDDNVITLVYDTESMSDTDKLQIFYDDGIYECNLTTVVYEDGDVLYICKATIGTPVSEKTWQIKKVDGMNTTWADGDDLFDNYATNLEIVKAISTYS